MPPNDRQRQQGFDAFRRGDFPAARRLLAPSAMAGEAEAGLFAAESAFRMGEGGAARYFVDKMIAGGSAEDAHLAGAAIVLVKMGDVQTAERLLVQATAAHPEWLAVRVELVGIYLMTGRPALAATALDELERVSGEGERDLVERLRADTLRAAGDVEGARALYRRCLERSPDDVKLAELDAFLCNASSVASAREGFEAHARFGRLLERGVARLPAPPRRADDPERRLRIGFVSDNFAAHSIAHFLTGPLKHLDREGFAVWAFSTNAIEDDTTDALSGMCDEFVRLPGVTPQALAQRVQTEKIDVLVDLNGLTQGHRLGAFAMRPAPLAVTWLAYPSTTGLTSIDLRIVDSITDPPAREDGGEGADALATERLVRLDPCFVCFTPLYDADAAREATAPVTDAGRDHVVFGCFNNAVKITDDALAAWSAVLAAVPRSRLLVKGRGLSGEGARAALTARMARAGIDQSRTEVLPETPTVAAHLAAYRAIDIQLDTFPYNGTTTTCESLLMGVPVVTLRGEAGRHGARVGASLLSAAGLPELAFPLVAGYVQGAVALAADRERLRELRRSLRERVLASALCDAPAFGVRFGDALRAAWRERCARP